MIKQFLPTIARGVYRLDQELCQYKKNDDITGFIQNKLAFLPYEYRAFIVERLGLNEASEAQRLLSKFCPARKSVGIRKKYTAFFEQHDYFNNWKTANDADNFLEIEFVKKILAATFTLEGLNQFEPQKPIASFYADFAICGDKNYVIEIDGFAKFNTPDALDNCLKRQNYWVEAGWTVYRYGYQDILQNADKTANDLYMIFQQDSQLGCYLEKRTAQQSPPDTNKAFDSYEVVNLFYAIQDDFVAQMQAKSERKIVYIKDNLGYDFPLSALALSHLYHYFESLIEICELSFHFPAIHIITAAKKSDLPEIHQKITLVNKSTSVSKQNTYVFDKSLLLKPKANAFSVKTKTIPFRSQSRVTDENIREKLRYFATSIFGYKEGVTFEQARILKKIFNGSDVLGLLPTGSGKSFCFWLPALLKPGLTIVISPLRSLMRDQDLSLKINFGIHSTAFINVDVKEAERKAIYVDIKLGGIKLLYVAPERLRIRDFRTEFHTILESVPINFLVIDEAHCISEWGHDFRPSYLGIPDFVDYLKQRNPQLTLIALTATAGDIVRQDLLNILRLRDAHVVSATNFDRPNLSYQIIQVNGYQEKAASYQQVIQFDLPTALNKPNQPIKHIADVLNSQNQAGDKAIGVVFCIYADPHGEHSIKDGIAHYLQQTQALLEDKSALNENDFGTGKIRGFSSKYPTLCPSCHSPYYINIKKFNEEIHNVADDAEAGLEEALEDDETSGGKICIICKSRFDEPLKPKKWEALTNENQKAFKRSELDLLVSTKGFGMGIDKSSVRFVVHTSMAGGLEAWYQEAGRSGRDFEHAHCVQIVDMPNTNCRQNMMERATQVPACSAFRCPFDKEGLCDYGKQHRFICNTYPSVESDLIQVLRVLNRLFSSLEKGERPISVTTTLTNQKNFEMALYRLTIIGYVSHFFIKYGRNVTFKVKENFSELSDKAARLNLLSYLKRNDISQTHKYEAYQESDIIADIEQHKEKYWSGIEAKLKKEKLSHYSKQTHLFTQIAEYMLVILHHTYDEIKVMRYRMLETLKDVIDNANDCQRKVIVNYFAPSGEGIIKGDYQCGFCNHCVADLNFQRDYAKPLEYSKDSRDIQLRLQDAFKQPFDFEINQRLADDLRDYPKYAYAQAVNTLSGSPRNLTAWFFARAFSPEEEITTNALGFIKVANEDLGVDEIKQIYQTTDDALKLEAFNVLDDEYGACNCFDGEQWLYQESCHLSEKHKDIKERKEHLGLRVIANQLAALALTEHLDKTVQLLLSF
jgi:ATP-dependent DNA helicase RecQ